MFAVDVQARASRVAATLGRLVGVSRAEPVLLRASRHMCFLLSDIGVVARVTRATEAAVGTGIRELHVARYLRDHGAPVVGPCDTMPSEPLIEDGLAVTLWPYVAHEKVDDDSHDGRRTAADALRRVHEAFATYPGELPRIHEKIEQCAALLRRPGAVPALAADDRSFLLAAYDRLREDLARCSPGVVPIHGDAHLGNVFLTPRGPLWTDFEAASLGPREWDAAGVLCPAALPPLDPVVYRIIRDLRSLCLVVWCSAPGADAEKREAADHHLGCVKASLAR